MIIVRRARPEPCLEAPLTRRPTYIELTNLPYLTFSGRANT